MRIAYVTATGADDETSISDMMALSRDYPIEWGLLLSRRHTGHPRFPSYTWLKALKEDADPYRFRAAGHLCGGHIHDLMKGIPVWALPETNIFAGVGLTTMFHRYQLNFHGEDYQVDSTKMIEGLRVLPINSRGYRSILIMQMDGVNDFRLQDVRTAGFDVYPLFDRSHGAGVLPAVWPPSAPALEGGLHLSGYAGGLTPENVAEQLKKIADVVGDGVIWIDAETGLRDKNDRFDLIRVGKFAQAASEYF